MHDSIMVIPKNVHQHTTVTKEPFPSGWLGRASVAVAGLALASIGAVTAARASTSLSAAGLPATTTLSPTALLDGERFAALVDEAVVGMGETRSALLDGERFAALVDEAVTGIGDLPDSQ